MILLLAGLVLTVDVGGGGRPVGWPTGHGLKRPDRFWVLVPGTHRYFRLGLIGVSVVIGVIGRIGSIGFGRCVPGRSWISVFG